MYDNRCYDVYLSRGQRSVLARLQRQLLALLEQTWSKSAMGGRTADPDGIGR
jgi:hypothetical protein